MNVSRIRSKKRGGGIRRPTREEDAVRRGNGWRRAAGGDPKYVCTRIMHTHTLSHAVASELNVV